VLYFTAVETLILAFYGEVLNLLKH